MPLNEDSVNYGGFNYSEVQSDENFFEFADLVRKSGELYVDGLQVYQFPHRAQAVAFQGKLEKLLGEDAKKFLFGLTAEVDWHDDASLDIEYRGDLP